MSVTISKRRVRFKDTNGVYRDVDVLGSGGADERKSIRILGIGNSFTRDSFRWLWKILREAGYDEVVVGHGYYGGITLKTQYRNLVEGRANYQYWKYTDSKDPHLTGTDAAGQGVELLTIIKDEPWDIVVLQNQSDWAGQYDSYVSDEFDVRNLVDEVKRLINNPNLKTAISSTWSHAKGYEDAGTFDEKYHGDPDYQLWCVQDVVPRVSDYLGDIDYIVNCGEAVRIARQNEHLNKLGYEMLRADKIHILRGIPEFMISYLFAATLCGVKKDDFTWYPTDEDNPDVPVDADKHPDFGVPHRNAFLADLAKNCADQAISFSNRPDITEMGADVTGSDKLRWVKYKNKMANITVRTTVTTAWSQWGSMYRSDSITVALPFGLAQASLQGTAANQCIVCNPTADATNKTVSFRLLNPKEDAPSSVSVHLSITGSWDY